MKKKINQNNIIECDKIKIRNINITLCLILIVTIIVFSPSFKSDFVNFDDHLLVTDNMKIKSLSWQNIKLIFTSFHGSLYHPLVLFTHAIEYHFFKLNPHVYHTSNIILHLLNCMLVFWFIHKLGGNILSSTIVALLFGIHPLHIESVSWVTGRKDVLYGFFFLISLILYLYYREKNENKYYYLMILTFILSLLSKPMAVTLPVIILLCDYIARKKITWKNIANKLPFFLIGITFGIVTVIGNRSAGNINPDEKLTFLYNILNASGGIIFYIIKTIIPVKLSCAYPQLDKMQGIFGSLFNLYPLIILVLAVPVVISLKYTRKVIFGSLFFLITIAPVLHFLPVGRAIHADRYTYIPLIGIFYIAGEAFSWIYFKKNKNFKTIKILSLVILVLVVVTFSILAWRRTLVWRDSMVLNQNILENYPNVSLGYNGRGNVYFREGEYDKAISDFNKAIEISPAYTDPYLNRGNAYLSKREYNKAINDYNKVLEINPSYVKAYVNRGIAYSHKGEFENALSNFNMAIKSNQFLIDTYYNRGLMYKNMGDYKRASNNFNKVLNLDPTYELAKKQLATVSSNDNIKSIKKHLFEGNTLAQKGMYDEAIKEIKKAIEIQPENPHAYYNLAVIYWRQSKWDKAIEEFEKVKRINPNYGDGNIDKYISEAKKKLK